MIMLKGIEKTYCGKEIKTKVLKGVDLSISKGEFVCIFGESGSRKILFTQYPWFAGWNV